MRKKFLCMTIVFIMMLYTIAEASVLGTYNLFSYSYEAGDGLILYNNRFLSDQEGVGNQTENYFSYTPNEKTRPVVTVGEYVFGGEDINECYSYLKENGIRPLAGINGDFFSVKTGIPSGHTVINKKIITADERPLPALGIKENGEAFISDLTIIAKMKFSDSEIVIPYINKYFQHWNYYMYDSSYYSEITPNSEGTFITFEIKDGKMEIGNEISAVVTQISEHILDEETNNLPKKEISENEIVVAVSKEADQSLLIPFSNIKEGDEVSFSFTSDNDEIWSEAEYILASEAGKIVENGVYCGEDFGGASPRTAVGIKENKEVVFYTIDGRNQGHSFGVRIPTLAERMLELGCVDVLNLDGGGSTTISASLFGGEFSLLNTPSDGSLRNVATYIFFENTTEKTNIPDKLFIYPQTLYLKSGAKGSFDTFLTDSGYFSVPMDKEAEIEIDGNSYITHDGYIRAVGEEKATITAKYGNLSATSYVVSVDTPHKIEVTDKNGKEVEKITLNKDETIDLNVVSYYNGIPLISQDNGYLWEVKGNTGTINENGEFVMGEGNGSITITAGKLIHEIPIEADPFSDISGSWARHYINSLYDKGVVNGFLEEDGGMTFKPSNHVTKSEMATMLSRAMKLETEEFENVELPFCDTEKIPSWALPHVKALYGKEIIKGTIMEDGNIYFLPENKVNRAEIFTIMGRILDIETTVPCPFSDRETFPDWAVSYIDALYERGMINGYGDNELKVWGDITRAEISKIIMKAIFA